MRVVLANGEGRVGVEAAVERLRDGGGVLDAVEQGVRHVEADPDIHSVGLGGHPNLLGEVECDAAIMDGATLACGTATNLVGIPHAVSVARQVMERLPHVFLAGAGANRFAREVGAEEAAMLTPPMRAHHEAWLQAHVPADLRPQWPDVPLAAFAWESARNLLTGGTTIFLARDAQGNLGAATSTSGWARKYPGRVGDTPIVGAGLYADNRYGACGCTHTGEVMIRACTARSVILYMKRGASVEEACREALEDLRALRGGHQGPVVIHAIDRDGRPCVVSSQNLGEKVVACYWTDASGEIERIAPACGDGHRDV